jgi:hypothetical protein
MRARRLPTILAAELSEFRLLSKTLMDVIIWFSIAMMDLGRMDFSATGSGVKLWKDIWTPFTNHSN